MKITGNDSFFKKLLLLLLILAGLYVARDFLIPLAIGTLFATLFLPICKWLERKGFPRGLAAFTCLLILLIVVASIASLVGWQLFELTKDIDQIKQKSIETVSHIEKYIYMHLGISIEWQSKFIGDQQPLIAQTFQHLVNSLTTISVQSILIMVYVLFLLYYHSHIRNFVLHLAQPEKKEQLENVIYRIIQVTQQYLIGLSKMIVCLWIMYGIGFSALGVRNALFFAFLCGLLEIVPYIGNITGTTITVLVAAAQGSSPAVLVGIAATYGAIQFIQGWVLEPLIVGTQVKINALFTIIALVVGELIWGIPGVFLAIPLIGMFKIVCDHVESLKPLGELLGEDKTRIPKQGFLRKVSKPQEK